MPTQASEALRRFNHLAGEIDGLYHGAALRLGLSDSAMRILYTICNEGKSCPLTEICKLSGLTKQTVNSALRKLEKEGILYLEAPGGRRKQACLTEKGEKLVQKTVFQLIQMENRIFGSWPEEIRAQYLRLTQEYLDAFREELKSLKVPQE